MAWVGLVERPFADVPFSREKHKIFSSVDRPANRKGESHLHLEVKDEGYGGHHSKENLAAG